MEVNQPFNKQILINLTITLLIPLIHWIYGEGWSSGEAAISDNWRGIIILIILLFGIVGGMKEIFELRYLIKSHLGWFFLTFMATAVHIMLYLSAIEYFGYDLAGDFTGSTNTLLIIGALLFTFYFLFELFFIFSHEINNEEKSGRKYGWSDFLLSIYAAFGSVYIWDVMLGEVAFKFENLSTFIIGELIPAILLFLMLILPFKRYDLMEGHGVSKSKKEKTYLFLTYLAMITSAILPRIFELWN